MYVTSRKVGRKCRRRSLCGEDDVCRCSRGQHKNISLSLLKVKWPFQMPMIVPYLIKRRRSPFHNAHHFIFMKKNKASATITITAIAPQIQKAKVIIFLILEMDFPFLISIWFFISWMYNLSATRVEVTTENLYNEVAKPTKRRNSMASYKHLIVNA